MPVIVLESFEATLDMKLQKLIALRMPDYIVEVGSFNGEALRQFGLASPYTKTIGFEANPRNFFRFCVGKNIQNMAVSNKSGISFFYDSIKPGEDKTGSIFKKISETEDERRKITVATTTLDNFFKIEISRNKSFILIIDAEGAAYEILEGAQRFLKNTIALKVEVETTEFWHGQKLADDVVKFLENFTLVARNKGIGRSSDIQKNLYFLNNANPGDLSNFYSY